MRPNKNKLVELKYNVNLIGMSEPILLVSAGRVAAVGPPYCGQHLHRDKVIQLLMMPVRSCGTV